MIIFCDLMIMILIFGLVILCRYLIQYAFYKEPLQNALRRRKAWLIKMKASREFELYMLMQKKHKDPFKEEKRLRSVTKLNLDIVEFDIELSNINVCISGLEKE